jgi:hypothetical protein
MSNWFEQPEVVKPGHPFQQLLGLLEYPAVYQFSLVKTVDGLGQGVVIAIPLLPIPRGLYARFGHR